MNKEIDYLKEHLFEIYKYKKSMKDLTYDMNLENLLRTCKALDYSQQEINRLNNIIDELEKYMLERRLTDIDGRTMVYQILNKLNELRGDNK